VSSPVLRTPSAAFGAENHASADANEIDILTAKIRFYNCIIKIHAELHRTVYTLNSPEI